MDKMINDGVDNVMYVIKVQGVERSMRFTDRSMAEQAVKFLPEDEQSLAEVLPVTTDGKQLLLG